MQSIRAAVTRYLHRRSKRASFARYLKAAMVAKLAADPVRLQLGYNRVWLSCLFIQVHDDTPEEIQRNVALIIPICLDGGGTIFNVTSSIWLGVFGKLFKFNDRSLEQYHRDSRAIAAQIFEVLGKDVKILTFEGDMAVGNFGSEQRFNYTVALTNVDRYLSTLLDAKYGILTELKQRRSEIFVIVDEDGAVYELNDYDKAYLDKEFLPFDGDRPYIKSTYDESNGRAGLRGYLHRRKVPDDISINPPLPMLPEK